MTPSTHLPSWHAFQWRPEGTVCTTCGKRWDYVIAATQDDLSRPDRAHVGGMTRGELEWCQAEQARVFALVVECAA